MAQRPHCPICLGASEYSHGYLEKMSRRSKLLRFVPVVVGAVLPPSGLRSRFLHGKAMLRIFGNRAWHFCPACALGFIAPMPNEQALNSYYASSYWDVRTGGELFTLVRGGNLERPRRQMAFMRGAGLEGCARVLDFGAGICGGALVMKEDGFAESAAVYDISSQTKQIAEEVGLTLVPRPSDCQNGSFDLLYTSHVIEHVPALDATLGLFARLVAPGGHVFVEVPNVPDKAVLKSLHHAPHTLTFSARALSVAMENAGFAPVAQQEYEAPYSVDPNQPHLNVPRCLMGLYVRSGNRP